MNFFAFSGLLTFVTSLAFGVFSWIKGKKFLNKLWAVFCLMVSVWGLGAWQFATARDQERVFLWLRIGHIGVILMPAFFLHFIFEFLEIKKKIPVVVGYILGIFFVAVNVTDQLGITSLLITSLRFVFNEFYVDSPPGPWYPLFLIFYFGVVIYSHRLVFIHYKRSSPLKQKQIQYFLSATVIGFGGGVTAFFMVFGIDVYPAAHITVPLYPVIMSYAILNYRLMDIEVIIKKTLVFAGLFAAIYGVFVLVSSLGQRIFENFFGFKQALAVIPTVVVLIFIHEPLKKFLIHTTDRFLFQKKYTPAGLLRAFSREVVAEYDINQITRMTTETLSQILRVTSCAVFISDKNKDGFALKAAVGLKDKTVFFDRTSALFTELAKSGVVLCQEGSPVPANVLEDLKKADARIALAIATHKETISILTLGPKKSDEDYTKEDVELLKSLCDALGLAINTALVFEDTIQKEKLITVGTMVAGIRHDISTPINLMNMSIQLFLRDKTEGRHRTLEKEEVLSESYSLLERCKLTFEKVVTISAKFANVARPKSKHEFEPVAPQKIIETALAVIEAEAALKGIAIMREIQGGLPLIRCDEDYMQQILFNILRNAMYAIKEAKRSKEDSKITVSVKKQNPDKIRIEIADAGTGIPEDKLQKIFESYYTTKPEGVGTGLGLVIVKELTERMKGTISVKSVLGEGTTFILEFEGVKDPPPPDF